MADVALLTEAEIEAALAEDPLQAWDYRDQWIRRTFATPGWAHTMSLVQMIGYVAEAAWHHPDLQVGYAKVKVMLQTHKAGGVTRMDLALARRIEELATWLPEQGGPLDGFPKKWVQ